MTSIINIEISRWASELSGGDCPFAAPALASGKVIVRYLRRDILGTVIHLARQVVQAGMMVILSFDPRRVAPFEVESAVEAANTLLRDDDRLVLSNHPADRGASHGRLGVVFIQVRSEMISAVRRLQRSGYYRAREFPEWVP